MSLIAYEVAYEYFLSLKSRFAGTKPFCRWVRYFWVTQSSLNQKSRVVAVFKCMIIDLAFHVLFKSNPNVIMSLFERSERAMPKLTSSLPQHWPWSENPGLLWVSLSHSVVPAMRQTQDKKMERTLCVPWGGGPMEPSLWHCSAALGYRGAPGPVFTAALLPQKLYKLPGLWLCSY